MKNAAELSMDLGRVLQSIEEGNRQRIAMFQEVNQIREKIRDIDLLREKLETIERHVKVVDGLKNKGIGLLIGVALAASLLGVGFRDTLARIGGWLN